MQNRLFRLGSAKNAVDIFCFCPGELSRKIVEKIFLVQWQWGAIIFCGQLVKISTQFLAGCPQTVHIFLIVIK